MPIITYTCENCNNVFDEFIHSHKNVTDTIECPKCNKVAKKNPFGTGVGMNAQFLVFSRMDVK